MSLFDLDSDGSSSSSLHSSDNVRPSPHCEQQETPATAAPHRSPTASAGKAAPSSLSSSAVDVRSLLGIPPDRGGRYTLTAADAARAEEERRRQAQRQRSSRVGGGWLSGGVAGPASNTDTSSATSGGLFGQSIAAALQLRKEDQEQLLLRRIRQQRAAEAGNTELVEKDLEVGVFVTPAYKALLRKQLVRPKEDGTASASSSKAPEAASGKAEEEEEPLGAFLRQLEASPARAGGERQRAPGVGGGTPETSDSSSVVRNRSDYYEMQMRAQLAEAARHEQSRPKASTSAEEQELAPGSQRRAVVSAEATCGGEVCAPPPSLSELQALVAADAVPPISSDASHKTASASPQPPLDTAGSNKTDEKGKGTKESARGAATSEVTSALAHHQRVLYAAREAGKRRRADDAFIVACARRCEDRMLRLIKLT